MYNTLMDDNRLGGDSNTDAGWQFKTESERNNSAPSGNSSSKAQSRTAPLVQWSASEYIDHKKGFAWYLALFLGAILVTALLYLFTRDILSSIIVLVLLGVFAVLAGRKPRVLEYRLDTTGIAVGNKFYAYGEFKSFTLEEAGPVKSITFLPMKRFMPPISVYFAPQDEPKITTALSQFLPYEQRPSSTIDNFMRSIRF